MTGQDMSEMNLDAAFARAALLWPEASLRVESHVKPSFDTLADLVAAGRRAGANLRRLGIQPGDVVAVQMPAWREWSIAFIAAAHAGAVILPIVPTYGQAELSFILRQSNARLLITPERWRQIDYTPLVLRSAAGPDFTHLVIGTPNDFQLGWSSLLSPVDDLPPDARSPDDLALLVYTSGTTASPKGVKHSNRTLIAESRLLAAHRRSIAPGPVILSPWPLGHIAGVGTIMQLLLDGLSIVAMDQWDAAHAARLIERHRVTCCAGTPFYLSGLLDAADAEGRDIGSLSDYMVGAAPVPPTLIDRCKDHGIATYRSYGSSEHPTVTVGHPGDPLAKRLETEGRPTPGTEIRFVNEDGVDVPPEAEGEIATRGPELFLGYFDTRLDAAAFLPDGWYRTGDIGRFDADGYLIITDRKKDIIIRGGENIASREVEDVLHRHGAVAEAAVVAAPDARMGERVCAFVVLHSGATLTLEDVRTHFIDAGVARHKTPEQLVIVDELPRNATGKVLKHDLRAHFRDAVEPDRE